MMDSYLCHSCYQRNDKDNLTCVHCGVVLRENTEEKVISEFIQVLTRVASSNKIVTYKVFYLTIFLDILLAIHLFIFGYALSNWNYLHILNMHLEWFEMAFYILSILMLLSAFSLLFRNKSFIYFNVLLIPVQLLLQANFLYFFKKNVLESFEDKELLFHNNIGFQIYIFLLGFSYSMLIYLLLFNYQLRRSLKK